MRKFFERNLKLLVWEFLERNLKVFMWELSERNLRVFMWEFVGVDAGNLNVLMRKFLQHQHGNFWDNFKDTGVGF
jgi:hypothetical protein